MEPFVDHGACRTPGCRPAVDVNDRGIGPSPLHAGGTDHSRAQWHRIGRITKLRRGDLEKLDGRKILRQVLNFILLNSGNKRSVTLIQVKTWWYLACLIKIRKMRAVVRYNRR